MKRFRSADAPRGDATDGRHKPAMPPHQTLILLWNNLGPYHLARAKAAADTFRSSGVHTIAVELCSSEDTRDWSIDRSESSVPIWTLSSEGRLSDRSASMAAQMIDLLKRLQPRYLAVAGYDRPEMRAALGWARRENIPAVLMSETKWDDRPRTWWRQAFAARQVRLAWAALVSGAASGEYLVSLGMPRERIFRQYGVVDNAFFAKLAAEARQASERPAYLGKPYFMACCRLIEKRKNLRRLLLAFHSYRRSTQKSPWDLVICGEGQDRQMLEGVVAERQIQGVIFAGFQQGAALARHYAHAGCFVHPAINEAWGLVVNEAMASGSPVLVSRRCGCAYDLVKDGANGYCFDPYNLEELTHLMTQIAACSQRELTAMGNASQDLISDWGPDRFGRGLLQAVQAAQKLNCSKADGPSRQLARPCVADESSCAETRILDVG